jgi:hypothetical protein
MATLRKAAAAAVVILSAGCRDASLPTVPDSPPASAVSAGVRTGWILTPRGEPIEVRYENIDGLSIMEGDIVLGRAGTVPKTREELLGHAQGATPSIPRGSVIDGPSDYTWLYGFVPYVISAGNFNQTQQQVILDAMAHVSNTSAGTRFMPRTNQSSYITFSLSSACNSPVGRQGGQQTINLSSGCAYSMGSVAHEILHSLGMWHEQSRCDRDSFIVIHGENIEAGAEHNFDKKCPSSGWFWDVGGIDILAYSEGSIMHYGAYDFSSNGQPTITSLRGLESLMGQRSGLNQTDASTLNLVYKPYPVQGLSVAYPSGTPNISWNAYGHGVTGYGVCVVRVYDDWNDYENTHSSWEEYLYCVGGTTGLSLQDAHATYTTQNRCELNRDPYGTQSYSYYYEVGASLPDGVTTQDRIPAFITPQYPPCFEYRE